MQRLEAVNIQVAVQRFQRLARRRRLRARRCRLRARRCRLLVPLAWLLGRSPLQVGDIYMALNLVLNLKWLRVIYDTKTERLGGQ